MHRQINNWDEIEKDRIYKITDYDHNGTISLVTVMLVTDKNVHTPSSGGFKIITLKTWITDSFTKTVENIPMSFAAVPLVPAKVQCHWIDWAAVSLQLQLDFIAKVPANELAPFVQSNCTSSSLPPNISASSNDKPKKKRKITVVIPENKTRTHCYKCGEPNKEIVLFRTTTYYCPKCES